MATQLGLVILWSAAQPERVGEVALLPPGEPRVLGRGEGPSDEVAVVFGRQRPGELEPGGSLAGRGISRRQLLLRAGPGGVDVTRVGRCPVIIDHETVDEGVLSEGGVLVLAEQLVLLCTRRPRSMPHTRSVPPEGWPDFGAADPTGLIGESPAMWRLRDEIALVAITASHVLVLGPSGAGKELVAGAVHHLSKRAGGPFVSRNAATLPEGLVDAELFGHAANYPQAGMSARAGLIGDADGGTLFLDEIGELDPALQAHLLRVLDQGEYQRLGDDRRRCADLRVVAATNRAVGELKGDFAARLKLRLAVPSLNERREDIPLLLALLLQRAVEETPSLRHRFDFDGEGTALLSVLDPELVAHLVRRSYTYNVRELDRCLWEAIVGSEGPRIRLVTEAAPTFKSTPATDDIDASAIEAALKAHDGNKSAAAAALGVSRYQLYRLLKRFEL